MTVKQALGRRSLAHSLTHSRAVVMERLVSTEPVFSRDLFGYLYGLFIKLKSLNTDSI